jgi:hypothetical protein
MASNGQIGRRTEKKSKDGFLMQKINMHLVIPDAHCKPESNPRRFIALGNFIQEFTKANKHASIKTIEMGDFEDMPSLSSYDRGKKSFEGRRIYDDIAVARECRGYVYSPVGLYQETQKTAKKKVPDIRHFALGGNHFEGRIKKFIQDNPELYNMPEFSIEQHAQLLELYWDICYIPYQVPLHLDGISYVHYWQNKMGKPTGVGKYPAATLLRDKHCSTVVGHSHILDRATVTTGSGRKLYALASGCFLDPEEVEEYAGQSNKEWWKGICILKDIRDGFPHGGEEFIPVETLLRDYL